MNQVSPISQLVNLGSSKISENLTTKRNIIEEYDLSADSYAFRPTIPDEIPDKKEFFSFLNEEEGNLFDTPSNETNSAPIIEEKPPIINQNQNSIMPNKSAQEMSAKILNIVKENHNKTKEISDKILDELKQNKAQAMSNKILDTLNKSKEKTNSNTILDLLKKSNAQNMSNKILDALKNN